MESIRYIRFEVSDDVESFANFVRFVKEHKIKGLCREFACYADNSCELTNRFIIPYEGLNGDQLFSLMDYILDFDFVNNVEFS